MKIQLLLPLLLATAKDDRISRSRGKEGGVVVLWPRVIPASEDPAVAAAAAATQAKLAEAVRLAAPTRELDVRPSPERVCPEAGCLAHAVGAVLAHNATGCVVIVTLSAPGATPADLVPWVGGVTLDATRVPFREPPENQVHVSDYVPCSELGTRLTSGALTAQLSAVFGRSP
jgi:hypothetical protein